VTNTPLSLILQKLVWHYLTNLICYKTLTAPKASRQKPPLLPDPILPAAGTARWWAGWWLAFTH